MGAATDCEGDPRPDVCEHDCLLAAANPHFCTLDHVKDYFKGRCPQICLTFGRRQLAETAEEIAATDCEDDARPDVCEHDCLLAAANPHFCTLDHVKDYFKGRCPQTCLTFGRRQLVELAEEIGRRQLADTAEEIAATDCEGDPRPDVCEHDCL